MGPGINWLPRLSAVDWCLPAHFLSLAFLQVMGLAKPLRALGFRLASWGYLGVTFGTAMGISIGE